MRNMARLALLPVAVLQLALLIIPSPEAGWGGGSVADIGLPPEQLIEGGLALWAVIFLAFTAFAVIANLKPAHVEDRVAAPLALAGFISAVWLLASPYMDWIWLAPLVWFAAMLCAWEAAYRLDVIGGFDGTGRRLLTCMTVGLLTGWMVVNLALSLPPLGRWMFGLGYSEAVWMSLWVALVPLIGIAWLFASKVSRSLWFFVALGWGLIALALHNWYIVELHGLAIAALIVGWIVIGRRIRYGASGSRVTRNRLE